MIVMLHWIRERCKKKPDVAPSWAVLILNRLSTIEATLGNMEGEMAVDYSKLQADIAAQTTVLQSVAAFAKAQQDANAEMVTQIADLKTALANAGATGDATVQATIDALDASIQANNKLASDILPQITANTPEAGAGA